MIVTALLTGVLPGDVFSQNTRGSLSFVIPYHLDEPEDVYKLPHSLDEISGLAIDPDGRLIAIQDEQAILFFIDPLSGEIKDEYEFGKRGDFEGVEFMNGLYYVLESDGTLFQVEIREGESESSKIKTRLHRGCDAEGLAADVYMYRLLILCKEKAGKGIRNARAVYIFDLQKGKLCKKALNLLSRNAFMSAFDVKKSAFSSFKPSAIAVHPQTGHIYIISSVDRRLVVFNRVGDILGQHEFDKKNMRQPEGLAFGRDGFLYVASEGAGKRGTILRFRPVK